LFRSVLPCPTFLPSCEAYDDNYAAAVLCAFVCVASYRSSLPFALLFLTFFLTITQSVGKKRTKKGKKRVVEKEKETTILPHTHAHIHIIHLVPESIYSVQTLLVLSNSTAYSACLFCCVLLCPIQSIRPSRIFALSNQKPMTRMLISGRGLAVDLRPTYG
jgi:hypothetical protein